MSKLSNSRTKTISLSKLSHLKIPKQSLQVPLKSRIREVTSKMRCSRSTSWRMRTRMNQALLYSSNTTEVLALLLKTLNLQEWMLMLN